MQVNLLRTGLFLAAVTWVASSSHAHALSPELALATKPTNIISQTIADETEQENQKKTEDPVTAVAVPAAPITHPVQPGESLSRVAEKYQTTWTRLFDKNAQIADPNIINVNDQIVIPSPDEPLAARELPAVVPPPQTAPTNSYRQTAPKSVVSSPSTGRASSAGNTYGYGYCTWYVKNRRPDMPNNLGNANTWVARAAAQGMATGSAPRAGAVGQAGMHVVYVESVNGDGTVTVSEMNRAGWNVVSSRTVPAGYFQYIY